MAFPVIKAPKHITMTPVDTTIKTQTDAGYVMARPRTTRSIYDFEVGLLLNQTDLNLLIAHDALVTGASIFAWYNHLNQQTYQVRYTSRPSYARSAEQKGWYDVNFKVQSV